MNHSEKSHVKYLLSFGHIISHSRDGHKVSFSINVGGNHIDHDFRAGGSLGIADIKIYCKEIEDKLLFLYAYIAK